MTPSTAQAWRDALNEDAAGGGVDARWIARWMPCVDCDSEFVCDVRARGAEYVCADCQDAWGDDDAPTADPDRPPTP